MRRKSWTSGAFGISACMIILQLCPAALADERPTTAEEVERLRAEIERLQESAVENRRRLEELTRKLDTLQPAATPSPESPTGQGEDTSALDAALAELPAEDTAGPEAATPLWSKKVGSTTLQLANLSANLLFAVGSSSERDSSLLNLQGGGHDPRRRGFTFQALELSIVGAVDPYFDMETHILFFLEPPGDETKVELEEAFLTSRVLPFALQERGFQLEAGHFYTEFGRHNPTHPHVWDWLDQPVVNSRFFGPDGLRNPGLRLGWLTPLPWFSELHFGVQSAAGETAVSFSADDEVFDERPVGGRPFVDRDVRSTKDFLFLGRWDNSWDLTSDVTSKAGASVLYGPNATGSDGYTLVYGLDLFVKWVRPTSDHGFPFVTWQSEIIWRDYKADDFFDPGADLVDPADDVVIDDDHLEDWGFYTQVLYGFVRNWSTGLRYEFAGGSGASIGDFAGRNDDPFRDDRHRVSPLVAWTPTEFSRVRLQYNYDDAEHLDDNDAHSVWLGFEVSLGSHLAHTF